MVSCFSHRIHGYEHSGGSTIRPIIRQSAVCFKYTPRGNCRYHTPPPFPLFLLFARTLTILTSASSSAARPIHLRRLARSPSIPATKLSIAALPCIVVSYRQLSSSSLFFIYSCCENRNHCCYYGGVGLLILVVYLRRASRGVNDLSTVTTSTRG